MWPTATFVAWSVCLSVCLLVMTVSTAKTAEPVEMPSGTGILWHKEPCIRWGPDLPGTWQFFLVWVFPFLCFMFLPYFPTPRSQPMYATIYNVSMCMTARRTFLMLVYVLLCNVLYPVCCSAVAVCQLFNKPMIDWLIDISQAWFLSRLITCTHSQNPSCDVFPCVTMSFACNLRL